MFVSKEKKNIFRWLTRTRSITDRLTRTEGFRGILSLMRDSEEAYDLRVFLVHFLDVAIPLSLDDNAGPDVAVANVIDIMRHKTSVLSGKTLITLTDTSSNRDAFIVKLAKKMTHLKKNLLVCVPTIEEGLKLYLSLTSVLCSVSVVDGSELKNEGNRRGQGKEHGHGRKPICIGLQNNASHRLGRTERFDVVIAMETEVTCLSVSIAALMLGKVGVIMAGKNPGEMSVTKILQSAQFE